MSLKKSKHVNVERLSEEYVKRNEERKRKYLDTLNKAIDREKILGKNKVKAPADVSYYDANVRGMVKARVMYLRIYEGGK